MLATRPEMQVAGDWMLVPAARNLHWRYEVLHSAFMVCKQKVTWNVMGTSSVVLFAIVFAFILSLRNFT